MSDDLVTWLRAQVDADEAVANDAIGRRWSAGIWDILGTSDYPGVVHDAKGEIVAWDHKSGGVLVPEQAAHIARHDPARVLREVEAKRRIIEVHEHFPAGTGIGCGVCAWDSKFGEIGNEGWCATLRLLAAPYADREGFRPEWAA